MPWRGLLFLLSLALVTSLLSSVQGSSYSSLNLRKRDKVDPNCKCTPWQYVDQCGDDCRQFRWRDCEPAGCRTEDMTVPCYSVEWGEWGRCDPVPCERTRSQSCMCLMRRISPNICMIPLDTETESCDHEVDTGEWGACHDRERCWRTRSSTCKCVDPSDNSKTTVRDSICGLLPSESSYPERCDTRVEHTGWSGCDEDCEQGRSSKCMCDDHRTGKSFPVTNTLCDLTESNRDTRECAREWGNWVHHEECPESLPEGSCHVFVKRFRTCNCINVDDQSRFVVQNIKCGVEPSKGSVACNPKEKCTCCVIPGTPAICHPTCNEEDEGRAVGTPPTCMCTPWWYKGTCPDDQMQPDWKICRVQASQWNDWSTWRPANCDNKCEQTRTRECDCFDGKHHHQSDVSKCDGIADKKRRCDTEWGDWTRKTCPKQSIGDCVVKTGRYRQCVCRLKPDLFMGHETCEGEYFSIVSDCPLDPYGECSCKWVVQPQVHCDPYRQTCLPGNLDVDPPKCICRPDWYRGNCKEADKPKLPTIGRTCPATKPFEWSPWSDWGQCDVFTTCKKTRTRQCSCQAPGERPIYRDQCYGDAEKKEMCETIWGPWVGGCDARDQLCTGSTALKTRTCCCALNSLIQWGKDQFGNHIPEDAERYCGHLGGSSTGDEQCPGKDFELTSWSLWGCRMDCKKGGERECECRDVYGENIDRTKCHADTIYRKKQNCPREWSDWSDADCGETTCVMKTRPKYRTCRCRNPNCDIPVEECPGKFFEIALKCPFIPPDDKRCRNCKCSEWKCNAACDHKKTRECGPTAGCDIEVQYSFEDCCKDTASCACTEWVCTESCAAIMIRQCLDHCDEEVKTIAQPCCEKEEECVCTEWGCKASCDKTQIRSCKDGCDIEEKPIARQCCQLTEKEEEEEEAGEEGGILGGRQCECSGWECTFSCGATMIRVCFPTECDIEQKPIAEPCCSTGETDETSGSGNNVTPGEGGGSGEEPCECGTWVGIECIQLETDCIQEEWRVCTPDSCDLQIRNVTGSACCDNNPGAIPEDCSGCGRWIDIGVCREGDNGTHQWRSVRSCNNNICEEFRCMPDGKHCKEDLCGPWYDIGECEANGETGFHQWRSAENCFCEPYRCHVTGLDQLRQTLPVADEYNEAPGDLIQLYSSSACTCMEWRDITGCDDRCINTETRKCSPTACAEEYRIQSGFCCT